MARSVGVVACRWVEFDNDALVRLLGRIPRQQLDAQPPETVELSERERTIVSLVAEGYSNAEIGRRLNLSKFTIRNNIAEIRSKLNVKTKTRLAALAGQYGLLDEPGLISGNEDASTKVD